MTSLIQLTLLTIGKTFVIFGLNLTETSSAHLEIQGESISLLLEPKHCGAHDECPEGSQCVQGFCFWERCLLSKKSKGISFRICLYFNVSNLHIIKTFNCIPWSSLLYLTQLERLNLDLGRMLETVLVLEMTLLVVQVNKIKLEPAQMEQRRNARI